MKSERIFLYNSLLRTGNFKPEILLFLIALSLVKKIIKPKDHLLI